MIEFVQPAFLWLLVALPLLALWKGRRAQAPAIRFPSLAALEALGRPQMLQPGWISGFLRITGLALAILALARPVYRQSHTEVEASGVDIVLTLDISGSMQIQDFSISGRPATRLEVAKAVVARFIDARPGDRIGLVAFGGRPFILSPPTLNHTWLHQQLDHLAIGPAKDSTAIGSGLAASANRLRDPKSKSKIIVLLTDGINNAGKVAPIPAAEAAAALGIKVYTIAAGTAEGATAGLPALLRQLQRMPTGPPQVDEETLQQIADKTGGRFYRATDTGSLAAIYHEIDQLEKTIRRTRQWEKRQELFAWFLVPAVALLILELLFSRTLGRQLP